MFAQFFGGYLLNKGLVKPDDLTTAIEDKKNTRMRLGVLAINAGLMTAQQVEHVNITQQSVDKRFGDLAVELGYVTADDVERLLSQQPTDYLLLGQTLVNNGVLTNAQFEIDLYDVTGWNLFNNDAIAQSECVVANANHSAGDLILIGGQLFRVTTAFAAGDTITTSMLTATSVAEEIAAQN